MNKNKRIEIYKTSEGKTEIQVSFEEDNVWLTQSQISDLFGKSRVTITEHIGNVFKENELVKLSMSEFPTYCFRWKIV